LALGILSIPVAIGCVFLIYFIAFGILSVLQSKNKKLKEQISENNFIASAIISPVVTILSLLIIVIISGGNISSYGIINLDSTIINSIIYGFIFGGIILISIEIVLKIVNTSDTEKVPDKHGIIQIFILIVVLASIAEEFAFRGLIQRTIELNLPLSVQVFDLNITLGIIIGAIIFSLVHLSLISRKPKIVVALTMISAFLLGIIAGYFYDLTNCLIAAIIVHMEFNFVNLIIMDIKNQSMKG